MISPLKVARILFALDVVLGILSIAGASLYGMALSPKGGWSVFAGMFIPFSILWAAFCYGAYRGLASSNLLLRLLFWSFVVGHVFAFPVGTAISGISIWLWREIRRPGAPFEPA